MSRIKPKEVVILYFNTPTANGSVYSQEVFEKALDKFKDKKIPITDKSIYMNKPLAPPHVVANIDKENIEITDKKVTILLKEKDYVKVHGDHIKELLQLPNFNKHFNVGIRGKSELGKENNITKLDLECISINPR